MSTGWLDIQVIDGDGEIIFPPIDPPPFGGFFICDETNDYILDHLGNKIEEKP